MSIQNPRYSSLYAELRTRCGESCGFLLTQYVFLQAIREGIARLQDAAAVRTARTSIAGISFTADLQVNAGFGVNLEPGPNDEVRVRIENVTMDVALHRTGVPADQFSTISFRVIAVEARMDVDNGRIIARRLNHVIDPTFTEAPTRAALIAAWTPDQIATLERFENFTAFASPATIADQLLNMAGGLAVNDWLIGLRMADPLAIERFDHPESGPCVLVRSLSSTSIERNDPCHCAGVIGGEVTATSAGNLTIAINTAPRANAPASAYDVPPNGELWGPYAFLYAPKRVLDISFGPSVYPAVRLGDSGSFAGVQYNWSVVVAFRSLSLDIDIPRASLLLRTDLSLYLDARAWINLPCDGEQELARAHLDGEINDVRLRVAFVFDRNTNRLVLDSTLENHNVAHLNSEIQLLGLGWPLSVILERVLVHNAPGMISSQLRSAVASARFTLLDLQQLLATQLGSRADLQTTFADATGMLVGIGQGG